MSLPTAASVLSGGLGSYPTVYYDRKAVAALEATLFLYQGCEQKPMPDKSGVAMQIFDYSAMSANTTAATEGTPGSGQTLTQNTRTINLSQYVDYVSFSDKVVLTAISDTVTEGSERLAYRGALSVDNVINVEVDSLANTTTAARIDVHDGSYMSRAIANKAAQQLQSVEVKPKASGVYFGVIHSLAAFDLVNDSATAGTTDLMKYSDALASKNPALMGIRDNRLGVIGGVEWYQSNALTSFASWESSAHTAYSALVIGKDALFASSLGKTALGQKNFGVMVRKHSAGDNSLDPAGMIAASAAYNFFFGVSRRPGNTPGLRRIRVESSIG